MNVGNKGKMVVIVSNRPKGKCSFDFKDRELSGLYFDVWLKFPAYINLSRVFFLILAMSISKWTL